MAQRERQFRGTPKASEGRGGRVEYNPPTSHQHSSNHTTKTERERDKDTSQHPTFTQPHIMRKTPPPPPAASSRETETVSDREGAITARQRGGQQVQFGEENGGPACAVLYVRRDPWYVCMYMSV